MRAMLLLLLLLLLLQCVNRIRSTSCHGGKCVKYMSHCPILCNLIAMVGGIHSEQLAQHTSEASAARGASKSLQVSA
jgi:hypothetical protein